MPLTKNIIRDAKLNRDKINALREKIDLLRKTMLQNMSKMITMETTYKGELKGYKLYYTYKVHDHFEPVYHKMTFKMDSMLLKITSVKDTIIEEQDVSRK